MTKEEYKKAMKELTDKIGDIKKEYINSNVKFKIGDKVIKDKGTDREQIGFVNGYKIGSWNSEITVKCVKCKKDGTPSKVEMFVYSVNDIELYDNAN